MDIIVPAIDLRRPVVFLGDALEIEARVLQILLVDQAEGFNVYFRLVRDLDWRRVLLASAICTAPAPIHTLASRHEHRRVAIR